MKRIVSQVLLLLCVVSPLAAGTPGDINGDGNVGLPEAVHALQVSSGIRPQGVAAVYDMAEYFFSPGTYEYKITYTNQSYPTASTAPSYTLQGLSQIEKKTIDGKEYIGVNTDYYSIDGQKVWLAGYRSTADVWYSPPAAIGSRSMTPGEVFTTFYKETNPDQSIAVNYREVTFLGTEDVATSAGAFPGCLKIQTKHRGVFSDMAKISYWARGVGVVKETYLTKSDYATFINGALRESELVSAKTATTTIPSGVAFHSGNGAYEDKTSATPPVPQSGDFTFVFGPHSGVLTLKNFSRTGETTFGDYTITLNSEDGVAYSDAWMVQVYPTVPSGTFPRATLTVKDGLITGAYVPSPTLATSPNYTLTGTYAAQP